jgi:hypothetical protein
MGVDPPSGRASPGDGPQPPAGTGGDAAQLIQILATEHVVALALFNLWGLRWFAGFARAMRPRFPSP